jgi:hypothetical protein
MQSIVIGLMALLGVVGIAAVSVTLYGHLPMALLESARHGRYAGLGSSTRRGNTPAGNAAAGFRMWGHQV